ncbi:MAG: hypothetical protein U1C18_00100, partial [Patescibacteria group bacterium]|nr:hypothetical protein [Patescibacteria group bacterium]
KSERQGEAAKGVKDLITGFTLTPPWQVEEAQKAGTRKALEQDVQPTGDLFADAAAIFTNTFAQTYLRRLQQGLVKVSRSRTADSLLPDAPRGSRAGLSQDYSEFSPSRALEISSGSVNLLSDMSVCPSVEDSNIYPSPYNCLLTTDMRQAVEQGWTVRRAAQEGIDPFNQKFPQSDPNVQNFSIANLKRLRFLRVIPLGWEIAAARVVSDPVSFNTLLDCFEDPSDPDNKNLPEHCPRGTEDSDDDGIKDNALYHLVDPAWVLDVPQYECRALAYGALPEYSSSPNRQSVCVDLASCLEEDSRGNCIGGYGYCTRERVTWQLDGQSCEPQYATC